MNRRPAEKYAVIGLGNTLRCDDSIGVRLLEDLRKRWQDCGIVLQDFGIASFDLINHMRNYDKVLLIDAIDAGLEPGVLKIFRLKDVALSFHEKKLSSHELSLSDLLRLCEMVGISADIQIAGIQVKDVSYGLAMTEELEAAKTRILEGINSFIESWCPSAS